MSTKQTKRAPARPPSKRPAASGGARKPASGGASRAAAASSPAPRKRAPAQGSRPAAKAPARARKPTPAPAASGLAQAFDGHGHDVAGVFLLVLGVLSGLGIHLGSAGPIGHGLDTIAGVLVGVLRYVTPISLVVGGVVLIRGPRRDVVVDPEPSLKRPIGLAIEAFAIAGIIHLLVDPGSVRSDGLDAFRGAGGFLGAALGVPLGAAITRAAAIPVLVLVAIGASVLITDRSLIELVRAAGDRLAPAGAFVRSWMGDLFQVGDDDEYEYEADDEIEPVGARAPIAISGAQFFDQDAEGNSLPAKRKRKPKPEGSAGRDGLQVTIAQASLDPNAATEQLEIDLVPKREGSPWVLPSRSLLKLTPSQEVDTDAVRARGARLEAALAQHGVQTRLVGMVVGPTVTRYELELGVGMRVNSVTSLQKDIAYALASGDVRIMAPIPGKQAIGVEVPNAMRQIVSLGDIMASPEAAAASSPLEVAVGRDIEGRAVMIDLAKMPHLLIAGQTGAGKSSCINSIMTSILLRATPDEVRMILVDPKRVELTQYNRVPHLLTQVVTNPKKAANALAWAVKEMERRYELLEECGCRDIGGYNASFDAGELVPGLGEERTFDRLPLILIVVDELADLMMVAARDVEESINRIAAKARAVGIHLVIATQRPSVNVITGVIKANIPARFAFTVASATDSKVILDSGGAEKLLGKGDLLFVTPSSSVANRIQGCFVDEKEAAKVVAQWRKQAPEVSYAPDVQGEENLAAVAQPGGGSGNGGHGDDDDERLTWQAMELVVRSQLGSTSMLQRKLKVGFARAGRLMDELEERGVVGPSEGSKARTVLISVPELDELLDQRDN